MSLHLRTLGPLQCTFNGSVTDLPRQHIRCALLILLACERQIPRARALSILWPDSDSKSARHALSQTLYALRASYGADWMVIDGETIRATDCLTIDVHSFRHVADTGALRLALALYRGSFLADHVRGPRPWIDWVESQRRELDALHTAVHATIDSARISGPSATRARKQARSPHMRAAIAAGIAFLTLVLHAATPSLMPAAITQPDATRYVILPFESDSLSLERIDAQQRLREALLRRTASVASDRFKGTVNGEMAAALRAARAAGAGRIITGRITHTGDALRITAECRESFGAGRQLSRAMILLRPPFVNADSAFGVLIDRLLADRPAGPDFTFRNNSDPADHAASSARPMSARRSLMSSQPALSRMKPSSTSSPPQRPRRSAVV